MIQWNGLWLKVKEVIASSKYLALSCDEVTTIDN
jgi:hypothetical protein